MLNSQFSSIYTPVLNEFLASVRAKYEIQKYYGAMTQALNFFQSRDMTNIYSDPYRVNSSDSATCYMMNSIRISPTFSKIETVATKECATAPNPESFQTDTCYTMGNKFNRYKLAIVNSARDNNPCLSSNARFNFLSKLPFRMMALMADLDLKVIEEFFLGLYTDYQLITSDTKVAPYNNWLNLSAYKGVLQLKQGGLDVTDIHQLSSVLMNQPNIVSLGKYVAFVGATDFDTFIKKIVDKNMSCCNFALGQYAVAGQTALQGYIDPFTGLKIVKVPDRFLKYDPTSKRLIYPVVNLENYYVTNGDNDFRYIENIRDVGHTMSSRDLLQIGNYEVYYRAANGDIQFEDASWEVFLTSMGSVRTSITDTVFYLLSDSVKTDQQYQMGGIKQIEHGIDPQIITVMA